MNTITGGTSITAPWGTSAGSEAWILLHSNTEQRHLLSKTLVLQLEELFSSHYITTKLTHSSDFSFDVPVAEANPNKPFFHSILAKVAAITILPKKIMNALSRKGRSRSKRQIDKPRTSVEHPQSPQPFVNVGLQRWETQRAEWTTKDPEYVPKRTPRPPPAERDADAEELYAALLTPNYQPLPRHVPLGELIVILQEVRELVG